MQLDHFVENLKETYGGNLLSIILYGSAAGKDFHESYSDHNVMILLRDSSLGELSRSAKLCRKWIDFKNHPPLFANREYLETSCDVFPLEFLDIQESRKILYGEDPFTQMSISREHLRLQCESELKGKILALRTQFLQTYPSKRRIKKMMLLSASSFFAIFRGLLRLLGEKIPPTKREILARLNQKTHLETAIFEKILDVREGKYHLKRGEILPWMAEYLTTLEKMARVADTL